jgi:virginiamycin A acetyltransferase
MANFFHPSVSIAKLVSIEVSSQGTHTYLGEGCVIDDFVKIKHVGGTGDVVIGTNCYLNSGCVLYSGNGIKFGNYVLLGPNCNIVPTNHNYADKSRVIRVQGHMPSKGGVIIEDDVWLGANVTVLDGAHIRKGCVIAANSVVMGETEAYAIYGGIPAKKIKDR